MKTVPSVSSASLWSGFWFVFNEGALQFAVNVSPGGKEALYLNGRLVSQGRRVPACGAHACRHGGVLYEVNVHTAGSAHCVCALSRNGVACATLRATVPGPRLWLVAVTGLATLCALLAGAQA